VLLQLVVQICDLDTIATDVNVAMDDVDYQIIVVWKAF